MIGIGLGMLAVLAYLGRSLVMLASVAGTTAALWAWRRRPLRVQVVALFVGAVGASLAAEVVHLLHHVAIQDAPDHGGFWTSAVLVGLINALAMLPFLGAREFQRRRTARQASAIAEGM
jgi:hypothetical protein